MALQSSGTISLSQVQTEFGGSNPISLSEYLRGGSYVPNGPTANNNIPTTTSVVAMSNYYGATKALPVSQFGGSMDSFRFGASSSSCQVTFQTDGSVTGSFSGTSGSNEASGDIWYSPVTANIGNNYWIRGTVTSGSTPSSGQAVNTWLALSSARGWTYNSGTGGAVSNRSGTMLFEISPSSSGTPVVCSGSFNFTAERES